MNEQFPESPVSEFEALREAVAQEFEMLEQESARVDTAALTEEQTRRFEEERKRIERLREAAALFE